VRWRIGFSLVVRGQIGAVIHTGGGLEKGTVASAEQMAAHGGQDVQFWYGVVLGVVGAVLTQIVVMWGTRKRAQLREQQQPQQPEETVLSGKHQTKEQIKEVAVQKVAEKDAKVDDPEQEQKVERKGSFRGMRQAALKFCKQPSFDTLSHSSSKQSEMSEYDDEESTDTSSMASALASECTLPSDAPRFPFLRVGNLVKNSTPDRIYPNTRQPQVFETPFASGKALVALRVKGDEDPFFRPIFEGRNRQFEIQFQITFKEAPRGVIYFGGELPKKMQLGIVTKGLCRAILSILNRLSSTVHAGFGKNLGDPEKAELPHIVFPLWHAATRLVVTRAGNQPPPLGVEIPETAAEAKARNKIQINRLGSVQKGDTVSFSINSMYMDMVRWKATGLGALGDLDLGMFWDTMPLHLVMYDLPGASLKENKSHMANLRRNYFGFAIHNTFYQREAGQPMVVYPPCSGSSKASVEGELDDASGALSPHSVHSHDSSKSDDISIDDFEEDSDMNEGKSEDSCLSNGMEKALQKAHYSGDYRVIAWLEHIGSKSKTTASFVLAKNDGSEVFIQDREKFFSSSLPKSLHAEVHDGTPLLKLKKTCEWEAMRSHLDKCFVLAENAPLPRGWLNENKRLLSVHNRQGFRVSIPSSLSDYGHIVHEVPVVRCMWETKWVEEWAVVLESKALQGKNPIVNIALFRAGSKTPSVIMSSAQMLQLRKPDVQDVPLPDCIASLEIECRSRVILLGFESRKSLQRIQDLLQSGIDSNFGPSATLQHSLLTSDLASLSISYESNRWGTTRRTILNSRHIVKSNAVQQHSTMQNPRGNRIYKRVRRMSDKGMHYLFTKLQFNSQDEASQGMINEEVRSEIACKRELLENAAPGLPWIVTSKLLRMGLALNDNSSVEDQIKFFDQASELRKLDILGWAQVMTESEKLCFAMNLYHALRIHGRFLIGQPSSILGWATFGSKVSYALGSGANAVVLSLSEIEHCVLRKPMTLARSMLATAHASNPTTKLFELTVPEPRINLCLNYGTRSCSVNIVVFDAPERVNELLRLGTQDYLLQVFTMDMTRGVIYIPRLCSWYARDFLPNIKDISNRTLGMALLKYTCPVQYKVLKGFAEHPDVLYQTQKFKWKSLEPQVELACKAS